jgi:hypothetical protein
MNKIIAMVSVCILFTSNALAQRKYTTNVNVNSPCITSNVESIATNTRIKVYPNPTNKNFTISLPFTAGELTILNALGQFVFYQKITQTEIRIEDVLEPGMYTIQVSHENQLYFEKVEITQK